MATLLLALALPSPLFICLRSRAERRFATEGASLPRLLTALPFPWSQLLWQEYEITEGNLIIITQYITRCIMQYVLRNSYVYVRRPND